MKAWSLEAINEFNFVEIDKPIAKEDEVIVKVRAVGICGSDIPRIYRTGTYHYPLIPGHEFSGEVVSAGGEKGKEWLLEKTDGNGADVFFECVGKNETVAQAVDLTAPAGHVMLVGNPYSDIALEKKVYWKILRNQLTVTGSWNSSFLHENNDDWYYVIECLKNAKISPSDFITTKRCPPLL